MATRNPFQFIQQVRSEISKVVWPSRREVMLTSAMVFTLAVSAALFFYLVDLVIYKGLEGVLSIFS